MHSLSVRVNLQFTKLWEWQRGKKVQPTAEEGAGEAPSS